MGQVKRSLIRRKEYKMAVKMGEFLGILMNITNKQDESSLPEDDVRTKSKINV